MDVQLQRPRRLLPQLFTQDQKDSTKPSQGAISTCKSSGGEFARLAAGTVSYLLCLFVAARGTERFSHIYYS